MMSYQSFFLFAAGAALLLLGLYVLVYGRNGAYHLGSVNVSKYIVIGCTILGTLLAYYAAMMQPPKDYPPSHQSIKNAISVQGRAKVDRLRGSEFRPSVEDGWVYYGHRQNNGKWGEKF